MEKDQPLNQHHHGGGKPPPSSSSNRFSSISSSSSSLLPASSTPHELGNFSHDISGMSEMPRKNLGHRRAHSEIIGLPDDISFDSDLGFVGYGDGPSLSDDTEEDLFFKFIDMEKFENSYASSSSEPSDHKLVAQTTITPSNENFGIGSSEKPTRVRHQHSLSMDGSTSIKPEMLMSGSEGGTTLAEKKAISAAKLAELAREDPKRAKRIWANRQSAARSKERKMRYISELERKVQTLQTEATSLSAQLTMLQRDASGLSTENSELKLRLQTMEQQGHLQDVLNDRLRDEVQRLKMITGQAIPNGGGPMMNFPGSSSFRGNNNHQFYNNNHSIHTLLAAHQFQQLQIQSQQQQPHQIQLQQQHQPHQIQLQQQHLQQQLQQLQQQQQSGGGDLKMEGGGGGSGSNSLGQNEGGGAFAGGVNNNNTSSMD